MAELWQQEIEADPLLWVCTLFPAYTTEPFGQHQLDLWDWVWSIRNGIRPAPYVAIWSRGLTKSTSAEIAVCALGARRVRTYGLYVGENQEQADDHVSNIGGMLESREMEAFYPDLASRAVGKYGNSRGWRRNRLHTRSGLVVDAIGLDTAARGVKVDEQRPDFLIIDDVDGELDSPAATSKKIKALTRKLLPAGANDLAVLFIQNLIHPNSIASQLVDGRADFLSDRIISGPIPAVTNLDTVQKDGRYIIQGGRATWAGMDLVRCQEIIDDVGITAFLAEYQHDVGHPPGGMFDHLDFQRCTWGDMPDLIRSEVWVDPAVTDTDQSDAMGIQADGLGVDGRLYRLWSWEQRTSPLDAITRAVAKAVELGASAVGVETDQGGDTWESVYREACQVLGLEPWAAPAFKSEKAGAGYGPKAHRAAPMLADYERCVAAGTLVLTDRGQVPVELVTAGSMVWTRAGYRRVEWAGQVGVRPTVTVTTSGGLSLTCTPDHPVFVVGRGFVHAERLDCTRDRILSCLPDPLTPARHAAHPSNSSLVNARLATSPVCDGQPASALTAAAHATAETPGAGHVPLLTGGLRRGNPSGPTACSTELASSSWATTGDPVVTRVTSLCTGQCGNTSTAPSPTAGTSTTSTATPKTTSRPTSSRSASTTISAAPTVTEPDPQSRTRLGHDSPNPCECRGPRSNQPNTPAKNAGACTCHATPAKSDSAHHVATQTGGIVSVMPAAAQPVYDLQVEGQPEFVAGGILVHNCMIVHVVGTHEVLERALRRFPLSKPLDLVDAAQWSWRSLTQGNKPPTSVRPQTQVAKTTISRFGSVV